MTHKNGNLRQSLPLHILCYFVFQFLYLLYWMWDLSRKLSRHSRVRRFSVSAALSSCLMLITLWAGSMAVDSTSPGFPVWLGLAIFMWVILIFGSCIAFLVRARDAVQTQLPDFKMRTSNIVIFTLLGFVSIILFQMKLNTAVARSEKT